MDPPVPTEGQVIGEEEEEEEEATTGEVTKLHGPPPIHRKLPKVGTRGWSVAQSVPRWVTRSILGNERVIILRLKLGGEDVAAMVLIRGQEWASRQAMVVLRGGRKLAVMNFVRHFVATRLCVITLQRAVLFLKT